MDEYSIKNTNAYSEYTEYKCLEEISIGICNGEMWKHSNKEQLNTVANDKEGNLQILHKVPKIGQNANKFKYKCSCANTDLA